MRKKRDFLSKGSHSIIRSYKAAFLVFLMPLFNAMNEACWKQIEARVRVGVRVKG